MGLLALAAEMDVAAAQRTLTMALDPSCARCRIELDPPLRLGTDSDPGLIGTTTTIRQNSRRWWLLSHEHNLTAISVYDRSGRFMRTVGRRGEGPGEYREVTRIAIGPADTVHVYDGHLGRRSVLSPDLQHLLNAQVPARSYSEFELLKDGAFLGLGDVRTQVSAGYPLHRVSAAGQLEQSFGSNDPAIRRSQPAGHRRVMSRVRSGRVWLAHWARYRLELWNVNGTKQLQLDRSVDWFPPHGRGGFRENEAPLPYIQEIQSDSDGLVWVAIMVADPNWMRAPRQRVNIQPGVTGYRVDPDRYWDTIIEVIDPTTGRVNASQRFDAKLHDLTFDYEGALHFVLYRETKEGFPVIELQRVRFVNETR